MTEVVEVVEVTENKVEEQEVKVNKYHIHVTGSDSLGLNFIENIVEVANLGAVLKEGTLPNMRFPHSCSMVLESETHPNPRPTVRVFEYDTNSEIFASLVKPEAAKFTLESVDETIDEEVKPFTKEQLNEMDWESEFKEVMKSAGITGRSRDKMTKQYISKFSE